MINRFKLLARGNIGQQYAIITRHLITTESINDPSTSSTSSSSHSSSPEEQSSSLIAEKPEHYDIIINGGGIVGLSFLLHIQSSPFLRERKVLLLEHQKDSHQLNLGELINQERRLSNRVSSLTLASKRFLQALDVWTSLEPFAKPTRAMHVWSARYSKGITFTPKRSSIVDNIIKVEPYEDDDHVCYVVENDILLSALRNKIQSDSIKFDTKLEDVYPTESTIELTLDCGGKITTNLLVGCDGFNSFVRKNSTMSYFNLDLEQSGIVGTIQVSKESDVDENDVAYQRFVPHMKSVLAILPLTDNFASFVLSVPRDKTSSLMEMSDDEFVNTLNEALFLEKKLDDGSIVSLITNSCDSLLGKILPDDKRSFLPRVNPPQVMSLEPGSRAAFPLKFGTTLPSMVGDVKGDDKMELVLIGDAAHRVHPLAGQGLNLGLGDAEILGQCLDEALANGEDIFNHHDDSREQLNQVLYNMERKRQIKLIPMMTAIQTMQDLFTYLPSNVFSAFNRFSFVKNEIVRFANSR